MYPCLTYSEYRKHGCLKISDFLKSKFSIFTIGEYRKHGFIKVGEKKSVISAISEKSAFSTWPSISSPIRRISFQKSFQKNNGLHFSKGTPTEYPIWGPMGGTPGFTTTPIGTYFLVSVPLASIPSAALIIVFHSFWLVFYGGPQFLARGISCR